MPRVVDPFESHGNGIVEVKSAHRAGGKEGFIKAKKRYQGGLLLSRSSQSSAAIYFLLSFLNNEHHRYGFPPLAPFGVIPPSPTTPSVFFPPSFRLSTHRPPTPSTPFCSFAASEPSPGLILKAIAISRRRKKGIKRRGRGVWGWGWGGRRRRWRWRRRWRKEYHPSVIFDRSPS